MPLCAAACPPLLLAVHGVHLLLDLGDLGVVALLDLGRLRRHLLALVVLARRPRVRRPRRPVRVVRLNLAAGCASDGLVVHVIRLRVQLRSQANTRHSSQRCARRLQYATVRGRVPTKQQCPPRAGEGGRQRRAAAWGAPLLPTGCFTARHRPSRGAPSPQRPSGRPTASFLGLHSRWAGRQARAAAVRRKKPVNQFWSRASFAPA